MIKKRLAILIISIFICLMLVSDISSAVTEKTTTNSTNQGCKLITSKGIWGILQGLLQCTCGFSGIDFAWCHEGEKAKIVIEPINKTNESRSSLEKVKCVLPPAVKAFCLSDCQKRGFDCNRCNSWEYYGYKNCS